MVRRVALYLEPLRGTGLWGRPRTPQRHCAPAASLSLRSMPLWGWGYSQPLRGCVPSEQFLVEACAMESLRDCVHPLRVSRHEWQAYAKFSLHVSHRNYLDCVATTNREAVAHTPQPHIGEAYVGCVATQRPRTAARFQLPKRFKT